MNDYVAAGPSPRARGAALLGVHTHHQGGTIPAGAGSRLPDLQRYRGKARFSSTFTESDILVKLSVTPSCCPIKTMAGPTGIEGLATELAGDVGHPARAGSRPSKTSRTRPVRDHPRTRGEQAVDRAEPAVPQLGAIPAHAGSRHGCGPTRSSPRDHPRVRGEQCRASSSLRGERGPSPHARGAVRADDVLAPGVGIIPACTGSRTNRPDRPCSVRDHPRVHGEQCLLSLLVGVVWGSSPRARGAVPPPAGPRPERGIIPACTGSSELAEGLITMARDHPRVHGEQEWSWWPRRSRRGSLERLSCA